MRSIIFDSVHKIFRRGSFFFSRQKKVETHALSGLSLEVFPGEVLAFLGPNGSGKSTTLKLASTMLLPDRGVVFVNGSDTQRLAQQVRSQVGFAVASERSFFPRLTVRENLEFFGALEDIPRRELAHRIPEILRHTDLAAARDKQSMKLSSGMYQRLGIARALIKRPSVLLLDEPTRSIDPAGAESLWSMLRELSSTGISILLATHNFSEAAAVADRVAILRSGELLDIRSTLGIGTDGLRGQYLRITGDREPHRWEAEVPA